MGIGASAEVTPPCHHQSLCPPEPLIFVRRSDHKDAEPAFGILQALSDCLFADGLIHCPTPELASSPTTACPLPSEAAWGVHNWPWCSHRGTSGCLKAFVNVCQGTTLRWYYFQTVPLHIHKLETFLQPPGCHVDGCQFGNHLLFGKTSNCRASMVTLIRHWSVIGDQTDSQVSCFPTSSFPLCSKTLSGLLYSASLPVIFIIFRKFLSYTSSNISFPLFFLSLCLFSFFLGV